MFKRLCRACGGEFDSPRLNGAFCSEECRQVRNLAVYRVQQEMSGPCTTREAYLRDLAGYLKSPRALCENCTEVTTCQHKYTHCEHSRELAIQFTVAQSGGPMIQESWDEGRPWKRW